MDERLVETFVSGESYRRIVRFLTGQGGIDVNSFKENYLKRRIYFRAMALKLTTIDQYYRYLTEHRDEVRAFGVMLTVNVSYFFRNPETFDVISREVLPELFRRKKERGERYLKILSIGCASGEEPYTIAILLREHFAAECASVKPYILGVDFDSDSIREAKEGVYDEMKLQYMSNVLKKKYFAIIEKKKYALSGTIRNMVVFRQDDVFSKEIRKYWDLVLCRNMLIYINQESQERLLFNILNACHTGGYLVLGKAEGLAGKMRVYFHAASPRERIYVKRRAYES